MSNLRKLQTEIDRVMKKVDEGVDLFDEIWEKVYSAEQQNQKEKYEMDLKKEIKKLQRLRDQIKTWIGSSDVKDKDALIDARKLIETKMEQFKVCEKETKTKTYSKEGLARQEKLDPAEQAKMDTTNWISTIIDKFNTLVEDREVEIERLSAGKGKKTNKHILEEYNQYISDHKYHINKLEGIMRLVNNDRLDVDPVNQLQEDLEYYLEAFEEEDFQQSYDEEYFYESLGLEELDVVNVDRVTQIAATARAHAGIAEDDESKVSGSDKSKKEKSTGKKKANPIPMTIGRARASSEKEAVKEISIGNLKPVTPSKIGRTQSAPLVPPMSTPTGALGPTPKAPPAAVPTPGGASMASILKRESEQEKERQEKALQQQQQQQMREQQQVRDQLLRQQQQQQQQQQQLQRQQQEAQQLARQQEALRLQQQQQQAQQHQQKQAVAQQQEALQRQQMKMQEQQARQQAVAQQEVVKQQQQQQLHAQQAAVEQKTLQQAQLHHQHQVPGTSGSLDIHNGLGGLSLASSGSVDGGAPTSGASSMSPGQLNNTSVDVSNSTYLSGLNESFAHIPSSADTDRPKSYAPNNPFSTHASFPSSPSPHFDNPVIFEKLGTDGLFFIFYYSQGSYQQYLAARELKKQSWRYHKKYMTWFQRHEEPKVTTDEYEEGTYVYFDYETGWCQRIKSDFRFEYCFLEDSLQ